LTFAGSASALTITTANQAGTAGVYPFTPSWTPDSAHSLIFGLSPSFTSGLFNLDNTNCNVNSLTSGGSLAISLTTVNNPSGPDTLGNGDTSGNYVTCGNRANTPTTTAGNVIIYTLPASAHGYNLTNITVFSGWGDNGRDSQSYSVLYSTVASPNSFNYLTSVNYRPTVAGSTASSCQVIIDAAGATIVSNVMAVEFVWDVPTSENSWCGYGAITVGGTPSASVASPVVSVTTSNQSGTGPFTPTWTAETPDLIAGIGPSTATGNFVQEGSAGTNVLTDGTIGISGDLSTFATVGNGGGNTLIYTLTNVVNGTDVTNIIVYSGWGNADRDGQYYTLSYSTIAAPLAYIPITTVYYNPRSGINGASANRVAIAMNNGSPLGGGVANLKFVFNTLPSAGSFDNAYQGFSEIIVQGHDTAAPPPPPSPLLTQDILPATVVTYVGDQVVFSATYSNFPPVTPQWQKITAGPVTNNINAGVNTGVVIVNSGGVTTSTLTLSNVLTTDSGTYTLEGLNATNGAAAPSFSTGAPLTVSALPAPVNNIVVGISGQFGLGPISPVNASTNFYPTWTENTNNDLIYGSVDGGPSVPGTVFAGSGSFAPTGSACNGDPVILSDGTFGYINSWPGVGGDQTMDGVGNSAGQSVTYTLPSSSVTGWSLTNITVYGGWGDGGRDEQKYEVLYSTVLAPTVFNHLISVDYNPVGVPANTPSAVRTILNPGSGAMAQNVYAIEFNFNNAGSPPENNWVGLSEIVVAGIASPPIPVLLTNTTPATAEDVVGSSVTLYASFSGAISYQWLKNGTNLPGATSPTLTLTNLQPTDTATNGGYKLLAINASGTNSSASACTVYVDPAPTPVGNITTSVAYQTDNGNGFTPTWDTSSLGSSLIAGQTPPIIGYDTAADFTEAGADGGLPVLMDGNYGLFDNSAATHPAFAACGNGGGNPGNYVIYQLGNGSPAANGYDVTNIQIAGGWNDNGRNSQYYTVKYSTAANPTMFYPMVAVANRLDRNNAHGGGNGEAIPSGSGIQSTIRTTFAPVAGVLASNVAAIEVDFQFPSGVPNGWSGYSEISVFGSPSAAAAPAGPVITTEHEEYTDAFVAETPNLIAYQQPSSATGLFLGSPNSEGCTTPGFTDGVLSFGGNYNSGMGGTDTNYSYQSITYTCTNGGWNLTNIVTYSLWHDYGRAGQFYNLSYSTTSNPTVFLPLASVAYAPFVPHDGRATGNRVQIAPAIGQTLLASNVAAVKFDFTPQGSQNFGWSGYTEIIVQGTNANGSAAPVGVVQNPSFEVNVAPVGNTVYAVTAWHKYNNNADGDIGCEQSGGTDFTVYDPLAATAAGNQFCYVNMFNPSVTGGIYQDVGALQPNTPYTLTVAIGSRADRINSPGIISLINGTDNTGTVLASGGGLPATQNTWQDYSVSFTTGPSVSGDLTIALSVLGDATLIQADFDNVRLRTTPVAPTLGAPRASGGDLILTGTGGTPNSGYTWLTTTNLSAPIIWTTNSTGNLNGVGAFTNSIPIGANPDRFFRLRLP
jgi:hypothetical protein